MHQESGAQRGSTSNKGTVQPRLFASVMGVVLAFFGSAESHAQTSVDIRFARVEITDDPLDPDRRCPNCGLRGRFRPSFGAITGHLALGVGHDPLGSFTRSRLLDD